MKKPAYNKMLRTLQNYPRDSEAVIERNKQNKERQEYIDSLGATDQVIIEELP